MAALRDRNALELPLLGALTELGQAGAPELARRLGLSQPTFSRLVARLGDRLLITGRARSRRYAARRVIEDVGDRVPVYAVDERALAQQIAILHPILPDAFYVESLDTSVASKLYPDLPYFLNDLRPSGFLGRLVPRQHPELGAPDDVRLWSAAHVLRYLARFGWDLPGNLLVGDEAFRLYIAHATAPPDAVPAAQPGRRYLALAESVLNSTPGSSAGGEQPKFLVTKGPRATALLVKFSPPMTNSIARRQADLLVAEHLAHTILTKHGQSAARSSVVVAGNRTFLEVERFDRAPGGGRRGVLSLLALDAEFVGSLRSWSESVTRLAAIGIVEPKTTTTVRWLELFGQLIGNSDMHGGNLSFFADGTRLLGLTPAYDMLPARYAGQAGNLVSTPLAPPAPTPSDAPVWDSASVAAIDFWRSVAGHARVSPGFRRIAKANVTVVGAWRQGGALLPAGSG